MRNKHWPNRVLPQSPSVLQPEAAPRQPSFPPPWTTPAGPPPRPHGHHGTNDPRTPPSSATHMELASPHRLGACHRPRTRPLQSSQRSTRYRHGKLEVHHGPRHRHGGLEVHRRTRHRPGELVLRRHGRANSDPNDWSSSCSAAWGASSASAVKRSSWRAPPPSAKASSCSAATSKQASKLCGVFFSPWASLRRRI